MRKARRQWERFRVRLSLKERRKRVLCVVSSDFFPKKRLVMWPTVTKNRSTATHCCLLNQQITYPDPSQQHPIWSLFWKKNLTDYMKIFGWLAFATNSAFPNDKFSPRGVPCVSLGYPTTQNGYKLLNLTTMLTFVSRDVRFHEMIFRFLTTPVNSYMHHILDPNTSTKNAL